MANQKKKNQLFPYLGIVIFSLFISCITNESLREDISFSGYMHAQLDSFQTKPILMHPVNMVSNDSLLIVFNFGTDTLFRVFSLPDCDYLGWFGMNGRGPREFLMANSSGIRFYPGGLQIADLRKIYFIGLPQRDIHDNYILQRFINIPGELMAFNHIFELDTNFVCGINQTRKSPLSVDYFNPGTNEISSFVDYPDFGIEVPENVKRSVYNYTVDLKPDKQLFALAYSFSPLLRISNKEGSTIHEIYINGLQKQIDFQNLGKKEGNLLNGIVYYTYIKATDRYIYLMYEPQKGERVSEHEYHMKPIGEKELHVFDWNGKPVARMTLKNGTRSFTPTPDDRYLYCTNDYAIDKIYRYQLNKILLGQTMKP